MSSFLKEFNSKADLIITNAVVLDATSAVDGQEIPPYFHSENAAWDTGAQFTFISFKPFDAVENRIQNELA